MTRRRIIAGVILLAAVAVSIPFAPAAWRAVAYESESRSGLRVHVKRFSWLPGPTSWIDDDQVCPRCIEGRHKHCWNLRLDGALRWRQRDRTIEITFAGFRCICADPWHAGD